MRRGAVDIARELDPDRIVDEVPPLRVAQADEHIERGAVAEEVRAVALPVVDGRRRDRHRQCDRREGRTGERRAGRYRSARRRTTLARTVPAGSSSAGPGQWRRRAAAPTEAPHAAPPGSRRSPAAGRDAESPASSRWRTRRPVRRAAATPPPLHRRARNASAGRRCRRAARRRRRAAHTGAPGRPGHRDGRRRGSTDTAVATTGRGPTAARRRDAAPRPSTSLHRRPAGATTGARPRGAAALAPQRRSRRSSPPRGILRGAQALGCG